jgi:hypothetical protein
VAEPGPVPPAGGSAAVAGAKRRRDGSPLVAGQPASAKGRFALARVMLAEGDRDGAARQVREAWRAEELTERAETEALETFSDLLTREDHRARMDKRIGAKDFSGASRAARRLGDEDRAIVKACAAVAANATKALDLLDAVATEARQDLGYTLCRINWMVRHDRLEDATLADAGGGAGDHGASGHGRMVAAAAYSRPQAARSGQVPERLYVVRDAAPPANEYYRADFHFMPGWIACATSTIPLRRARISPILTMERQSDRPCAGELLARPRRRGDRRERCDACQL